MPAKTCSKLWGLCSDAYRVSHRQQLQSQGRQEGSCLPACLPAHQAGRMAGHRPSSPGSVDSWKHVVPSLQVTAASTVVLAAPQPPLIKLDDKHYK